MREPHRARRAVLHFLFDEHRRKRIRGARVVLDLLLEMAGDVNDLLHVAEPLEIFHHVVDDRLAGDLEHRLGRDVRVRPEARAFARQRNDDFHIMVPRSAFMVRSFPRVRNGP